MSFFKKPSPTESDAEQWKSKYLALVSEYDDKLKTQQDERDLFCKTISHLSIAAQGLDKQLDPPLNQIHTHLKKGLQGEPLHVALTALNHALYKISQAPVTHPASVDLSLLLDLLYQRYPAQKGRLSAIQTQHQHSESSDDHALLSAFLDTLDAHHVSSSNVTAKPDNAIQIPPNYINLEHVINQITQLITFLEIPPHFETRAQQLKESLLAQSGAETFNATLSEFINLFQSIKKHLQLEQKEMENFLSTLTEQLSQLSVKASDASLAVQDSAKKRTLLDESVSSQMSVLQQNSADATTLESLKVLIKTRLASINNEFQQHIKNEALQRQEAELQFAELTFKIGVLDSETKELKTKLTAAYKKATRDTLTNLPNRRAFEETLLIEMARWQRYHTPLTMLIWDIDFFKKINDTYGHKAGDQTLIIIAVLLSKHCRKTDFVGRFGGEEFVMLLPNTNAQSALILANKIRKLIEATVFNLGGEKVHITLSCGLSEFSEGDTSERVFERTDQALYRAKANSRNCCCVAN